MQYVMYIALYSSFTTGMKQIKTLLLGFVLLATSTTAMAEVADSIPTPKPQKENPHYLAVNSTFFLRQFISFATSSVSIATTPYIFDYRFVPKHHGFRLSIGAGYNSKTSRSDSSQITVVKNTTVSYRAGYVYQIKASKRWTFIVGADIIGSYNDSILRVNTTTDVVTSKSNTWSIGGGPSLGIQFKINNRMGLFTETAIYYTYSSQKSTHSFANFPEFYDETSATENKLEFIVPLSLFFYVRF